MLILHTQEQDGLRLATQGNSVEMTFTGSTAAVYTKKLISGGMFDVYIDGVKKETVDTYNATDLYKQKVFEINGLTYGTHTIKLQLNGQKNVLSSGTWVGFDYFETL